MSSIRKLSAFRQLSLTNYDSPTSEQRRKTFKKQFSSEDQMMNFQNTANRRRSLKKQFSEDITDRLLLEHKLGGKTVDRPHPIKIAWAETDSPKDEGVIVKKCIKEVKKAPKITRHGSLEKDSILYSQQELTERLRQAFKEREDEKRNLNIFLAHNINSNFNGSNEDDGYNEPEPEIVRVTPKIIQPLLTPRENTVKNVFQIRKNKDITNATKSNAIVVIPIVEKEDNNNSNKYSNLPNFQAQKNESPPLSDRSSVKEDPKAIKNVIIRPSTAAAKRDIFKKRTNSAFNSIAKEPSERPIRPPLVRSSSAPTRPEQSKAKFLATKRKIKSGKKGVGKLLINAIDGCDKENPSQKELNRYVPVNGTDVETMVSLISPAASDNEEVEVEKPKSKGSPDKGGPVKKEEKEGGKNVSLRKTVKSVSFQQSSIHAIRSFSASFPGRRSSMATALMLGNGGSLKGSKIHEKRGTNSNAIEDDERGPKRRLVRSISEKGRNSSEDDTIAPPVQEISVSQAEPKITISIKDKEENKAAESSHESEASTSQKANEENITENSEHDNKEAQFGSVKEKQCWEMYCKMADKGLKVSYDTILRGMLTPTEYRLRRKESAVDAVEVGEDGK